MVKQSYLAEGAPLSGGWNAPTLQQLTKPWTPAWGCCHPQEGVFFSNFHKGTMWTSYDLVPYTDKSVVDKTQLMSSRSLWSKTPCRRGYLRWACTVTETRVDARGKGKSTIIEHELCLLPPVNVPWTCRHHDHLGALPILRTFGKENPFLLPWIKNTFRTCHLRVIKHSVIN